MREKRDQRTLIIVSLLVIVFIMVVGFAAFATNLTINGTANISTNWCVGFDNTKTTAYEIKKEAIYIAPLHFSFNYLSKVPFFTKWYFSLKNFWKINIKKNEIVLTFLVYFSNKVFFLTTSYN